MFQNTCGTQFLVLMLASHVSTSVANTRMDNDINKTVISFNRNSTDDVNSSIRQQECNQQPTLRNQLFATFLIFVWLVSVTGNGITVTIILSSHKIRRQFANYFLVSLAVADIGVSLFVTTLNIDMHMNNFRFCHSLTVCFFYKFTDVIFHMAIITHLFIIALDCFISIQTPFIYIYRFTRRKVIFIIIGIWAYVAVWASIGMFPWGPDSKEISVEPPDYFCSDDNPTYMTTTTLVIYVIPMFLSTIMYYIILRTASRQTRHIVKQIPVPMNEVTKHAEKRKKFHDFRAVKTISVVFVAYTVCWLPLFLHVLLTAWSDVWGKFQEKSRVVSESLHIIIYFLLPAINSCVNPFIYFLLRKSFRTAYMDLICKMMQRTRRRPNIQATVIIKNETSFINSQFTISTPLETETKRLCCSANVCGGSRINNRQLLRDGTAKL